MEQILLDLVGKGFPKCDSDDPNVRYTQYKYLLYALTCAAFSFKKGNFVVTNRDCKVFLCQSSPLPLEQPRYMAITSYLFGELLQVQMKGPKG